MKKIIVFLLICELLLPAGSGISESPDGDRVVQNDTGMIYYEADQLFQTEYTAVLNIGGIISRDPLIAERYLVYDIQILDESWMGDINPVELSAEEAMELMEQMKSRSDPNQRTFLGVYIVTNAADLLQTMEEAKNRSRKDRRSPKSILWKIIIITGSGFRQKRFWTVR